MPQHTLTVIEMVLATGALQGRLFTAEAIALALGLENDEVIDMLDELQEAGREHPLVKELELVGIPGGTPVCHYYFTDSATQDDSRYLVETDNQIHARLAEALERTYLSAVWLVAKDCSRLYRLAGQEAKAAELTKLARRAVSAQAALRQLEYMVAHPAKSKPEAALSATLMREVFQECYGLLASGPLTPPEESPLLLMANKIAAVSALSGREEDRLWGRLNIARSRRLLSAAEPDSIAVEVRNIIDASLEWPALRVTGNFELGRLLLEKEDYRAADACFQVAYDAARLDPDSWVAAGQCLVIRASIEFERYGITSKFDGLVEEAFVYGRESRVCDRDIQKLLSKLAAAEGDWETLASAERKVADSYMMDGNFGEAIEALLRVGRASLNMMDARGVLSAAREAILCSREMRSLLDEGRAFGLVASLRAVEGRTEEANLLRTIMIALVGQQDTSGDTTTRQAAELGLSAYVSQATELIQGKMHDSLV